MKLNQRLLAIARLVPKCSAVVDIGTDHALLPIYLLQNKIVDRVIAGDLKPGPLESARKNIRVAGLEENIDLRLGNGLEIIDSGEADVCIIAGMGGGTIRDILKNAEDKALALKRLILQPMGGAGLLREWLTNNGWEIHDEEIAAEEDRVYEIIAARPGREQTSNQVIVSVGPRLFEKKHPLLKNIISEEIKQNINVLISLEQTRSAAGDLKRRTLSQRNADLERILECLQSAKQ